MLLNTLHRMVPHPTSAWAGSPPWVTLGKDCTFCAQCALLRSEGPVVEALVTFESRPWFQSPALFPLGSSKGGPGAAWGPSVLGPPGCDEWEEQVPGFCWG